MPTLLSAKRFAKSIRLVAVTFGAPGTSGVLALAIRPTVRRTEIWLAADDDLIERVRTVKGRLDWRGAVRAIAALEDRVGLGSDAVDPIEVTGASGIAAELLALAWMGGEDTQVARVLVACTDDELARLRAGLRSRSFLERGFRARLAALLHQLDEGGLEDVATLVVLLRATLAGPHRRKPRRTATATARRQGLLGALAAAVRRRVRQAQAAAAAADAEHAARLAPYRDQIAHLLTTWYELQLPASGNELMGIVIRQARLTRFLESYALRYGRLPTGTRVIPVPPADPRVPQIPGIGPFRVDLDALAATTPEAVAAAKADARAAAAAARAERVARLAPHRDQIARLVATWARLQPSTTEQSTWMTAYKQGRLHWFLEAYAVEHGRLPTGAHPIPEWPGVPPASRELEFDVDFDALAAIPAAGMGEGGRLPGARQYSETQRDDV